MEIDEEVITSRIYIIRGIKVMIDRDLALLYGVETRELNQAVRRNLKRFPEDFMFQMNAEDLENWKSQIVISNREKMGIRHHPLVFTEQGVAMLSSVLNSEQAIAVNIQIIRVFTRLRHLLESHTEILQKLEELSKKGLKHDNQIILIFEYLKQLEKAKQEDLDFKAKRRIGYKRNDQE
ncbi:MAG: ORF6N domain-containing protein [Bacteroidales bacterium]|nr:ORF6N domain-containing protein [Bacteroidales bacterium]